MASGYGLKGGKNAVNDFSAVLSNISAFTTALVRAFADGFLSSRRSLPMLSLLAGIARLLRD